MRIAKAARHFLICLALLFCWVARTYGANSEGGLFIFDELHGDFGLKYDEYATDARSGSSRLKSK